MERKSIKVSIGKGDKQVKVDAEKRVWDAGDLFNVDIPTLTAEEAVKLLNYAEDLKVRALVRGEHTDTGSKQKNRQKATNYIINQAIAGDVSFQKQYAEAMAKGTKELNAYLDELYESTEELHDDK